MNTAKAKVYKITQTVTKYVVDLSYPALTQGEIVDAINNPDELEAMDCIVVLEHDPVALVVVRETEVDQLEDGYLDFDDHPLNHYNREAELTKLFGESV